MHITLEQVKGESGFQAISEAPRQATKRGACAPTRRNIGDGRRQRDRRRGDPNAEGGKGDAQSLPAWTDLSRQPLRFADCCVTAELCSTRIGREGVVRDR